MTAKKYYNFVKIETVERLPNGRLNTKIVFYDKDEYGPATELFYALNDPELDNHPNEGVQIDVNKFVGLDPNKLKICNQTRKNLVEAQERILATHTMTGRLEAVLATFH